MSQIIETVPEMHLYSATGERLYLNKEGPARFFLAANDESPIDRMFCQVGLSTE